MNLPPDPPDCSECHKREGWGTPFCPYHKVLWVLRWGLSLDDELSPNYAGLVHDVLQAWEKHPK